MWLEEIKQKVLAGTPLTLSELKEVACQDSTALQQAAWEIRRFCCGTTFSMCAICNGKSGGCSEDCKFCAQSSFYSKERGSQALLPSREIKEQAAAQHKEGISRFSVVTSGRRLGETELSSLCDTYRQIKAETPIGLCASLGLLQREQLQQLLQAGATRYHCNLETSEGFFPSVCTTHTFAEKVSVLKTAKELGFSLCSGGIIGLGETMEDRIQMGLTLREIGVDSVPINILDPIPGTPLEGQKSLTEEQVCRTIAVFRFLLPKAQIRLAGGRRNLPDGGRNCLRFGANAVISGSLLTTDGLTPRKDRQMAESLGFQEDHYE